MPFKSKAQQRWMFANDPKMAKEWADETPDFDKLPEKVKKSKKEKKESTFEPVKFRRFLIESANIPGTIEQFVKALEANPYIKGIDSKAAVAHGRSVAWRPVSITTKKGVPDGEYFHKFHNALIKLGFKICDVRDIPYFHRILPIGADGYWAIYNHRLDSKFAVIIDVHIINSGDGLTNKARVIFVDMHAALEDEPPEDEVPTQASKIRGRFAEGLEDKIMFDDAMISKIEKIIIRNLRHMDGEDLMVALVEGPFADYTDSKVKVSRVLKDIEDEAKYIHVPQDSIRKIVDAVTAALGMDESLNELYADSAKAKRVYQIDLDCTIEKGDPEWSKFSQWLKLRGITMKVVEKKGPSGFPIVRFTGSSVMLQRLVSKWYDDPELIDDMEEVNEGINHSVDALNYMCNKCGNDWYEHDMNVVKCPNCGSDKLERGNPNISLSNNRDNPFQTLRKRAGKYVWK